MLCDSALRRLAFRGQYRCLTQMAECFSPDYPSQNTNPKRKRRQDKKLSPLALPIPKPDTDLTIAELAIRYFRFAKGYYQVQGGANQENCKVRFLANRHSISYQPEAPARGNCRRIPRWRFGLVCGMECL